MGQNAPSTGHGSLVTEELRDSGGRVGRAGQTGGRGAGRKPVRVLFLDWSRGSPCDPVTRRCVIVNRHPVAEEFDGDVAGPDDRWRTAGREASRAPRLLSVGEQYPSLWLGPDTVRRRQRGRCTGCRILCAFLVFRPSVVRVPRKRNAPAAHRQRRRVVGGERLALGEVQQRRTGAF